MKRALPVRERSSTLPRPQEEMEREMSETIAAPARVHAKPLMAFITRAFVKVGVPAADADVLAQLMVEADLRGSDTHGVIRLPLYVRRLRAGGVNPRPDIRVVREQPSAALVDGDNGMGHLVMRLAAQIAIEKAKRPASAGSARA